MRISGSLQRWRERLRAVTRPFDGAPGAVEKDRQYELWACATAPEFISLAALMTLAEDDPSATNRGLFSTRN
jgi:hypothetical protein